MMGPHIEQRLEAFVSGEATAEEAARIRAHCDECPDCRRALTEAQAVWGVLGEAAPPALPASLWPVVEARIERQRSPRARLTWALGASAAAAAGLILGIVLGSQFLGAPGAWEQETWTQVGSLIADGGESTLDEVYVSGFSEEGDEQ